MATKLTDGKKTIKITMCKWDGNGWTPDWSADFFAVGGLPYDEERDAYMVEDLSYCIEQAEDWKASRGDYADDIPDENNEVWYDDYSDVNDVTDTEFASEVRSWLESRSEEHPDEHYELDGEPQIDADLGGIWVQYIRDIDDPEHGAYSLCGWREDSLDLDIRY